MPQRPSRHRPPGPIPIARSGGVPRPPRHRPPLPQPPHTPRVPPTGWKGMSKLSKAGVISAGLIGTYALLSAATNRSSGSKGLAPRSSGGSGLYGGATAGGGY